MPMEFLTMAKALEHMPLPSDNLPTSRFLCRTIRRQSRLPFFVRTFTARFWDRRFSKRFLFQATARANALHCASKSGSEPHSIRRRFADHGIFSRFHSEALRQPASQLSLPGLTVGLIATELDLRLSSHQGRSPALI